MFLINHSSASMVYSLALGDVECGNNLKSVISEQLFHSPKYTIQNRNMLYLYDYKTWITNWFQGLFLWKSFSGECHRMPLIIGQHWFGSGLMPPAITWANVNTDPFQHKHWPQCVRNFQLCINSVLLSRVSKKRLMSLMVSIKNLRWTRHIEYFAISVFMWQSSHWGLNNWPTFSRRHFRLYCDSNFTIVPRVPMRMMQHWVRFLEQVTRYYLNQYSTRFTRRQQAFKSQPLPSFLRPRARYQSCIDIQGWF